MRTPLLAVAALLAGCLAPTLTEQSAPGLESLLPPPLYPAMLTEAVVLPSFDGVPLSMHVYRPDVPEGTPVPIILNFSPYWGNTASSVNERGDNFSKWLIDTFVPRGYAVVLASVRGTGMTGGCFEMGGANEQKDSALTVEWLAEQPWSNGKVGAIAKSYDGTVANMAAVLAPKGLATIVPVSGITDWYDYLYRGGLPYGAAGLRMAFNAEYYAMVGWGVPVFDALTFAFDQSPATALGAVTAAANADPASPDDACPHLFDGSFEGFRTGVTGEYGPYWQERNYTQNVGNAKASLLFIHGLQDWNVNPAMIDPWYNAYPGPKKAILGQWDHLYPTRDDFGITLLRWFESELRGIDNGLWQEPAVQVQADDCAWRYEDDYPPLRATWTTLHPTADGGLAEEAGQAGAVTFQHNPANDPVPTGEAGDRVVFLSEPFAAGAHSAGGPMLRFTATSDRPATAFVATLYDVSADGEWREANRAYLHAGHRNSLESLELVTPGEAFEYTLKFLPQDTVFAPGHSVGLMIASQNSNWVLTPPTAATNTIEVGPAASLELPLVEGLRLVDPQPTMRSPDAYPYADFGTETPLPCIPGTMPEDAQYAPVARAKPGLMRN